MKDSVSLYIHIPFCREKCGYCDFYSIPANEELINKYINALLKEIKLINSFPSLNTIYIGGGNPAIISIENLEKVFSLTQFFDKSKLAEFTIEANPENVTKEFIETCLKSGVTRISLGVQSFNAETLKILGRTSTPGIIDNAVKLIKSYKSIDLNLDLIFAVPSQTFLEFKNDINKTLFYNPSHVSAYSLILADNTVLTNKVMNNIYTRPDEELFELMYLYLHKALTNAGYNFYEVSNFAKPGKKCTHNCNYWNLGEYLGIGASSSGYMNNFRYTNHANVKQYLDSIDNNTLPVMLKESVTPEITWTECIMLGLRTRDGVDLEKLKQISNLNASLEDNFIHFKKQTEKYVALGLLEKKENAVKCTLKGFLVLDELIMNLVFK